MESEVLNHTLQNEIQEEIKLIQVTPSTKVTRCFDKIADAMAKAQTEIGTLQRNKNGHNYQYADLAAVLDCIREPLAKYGLTIWQCPEYTENSELCPITTYVIHASGQMLVNTYAVPVTVIKSNNDVQAYGSAITYARRYALMALMNLAAEDDDAAKAKDYKFRQNSPSVKPISSQTESVKAEEKPTPVLKPGIQRAQPINTSQPVQVADTHVCADCGETIKSEKVLGYAMRNFKRPLCYACQEKLKTSKAS